MWNIKNSFIEWNSHVSVVKSLSEMCVISEKLVDFDPWWLEDVSEFVSDDKSTKCMFEIGFWGCNTFFGIHGQMLDQDEKDFPLQNWIQKWITF